MVVGGNVPRCHRTVAAVARIQMTSLHTGWRSQMFSKSDFKDLKVIVIGVLIAIAIFLMVVAFALGLLF